MANPTAEQIARFIANELETKHEFGCTATLLALHEAAQLPPLRGYVYRGLSAAKYPGLHDIYEAKIFAPMLIGGTIWVDHTSIGKVISSWITPANDWEVKLDIKCRFSTFNARICIEVTEGRYRNLHLCYHPETLEPTGVTMVYNGAHTGGCFIMYREDVIEAVLASDNMLKTFPPGLVPLIVDYICLKCACVFVLFPPPSSHSSHQYYCSR